jgi:hypothetical protein
MQNVEVRTFHALLDEDASKHIEGPEGSDIGKGYPIPNSSW